MFKDRAIQFRDRRGWDVTVDQKGWERDEYDNLNPLYVVIENAAGEHAASCRLLPTTGPTMLGVVFQHLPPDGPVVSPLIWELSDRTREALERAPKEQITKTVNGDA